MSLSSSKTEQYLRAVVEASRELLARDFATGLRAALQAVGERTGLERVYAVRYDAARNAGFFVAEHCAPGIGSVATTLGAGPYAYADYAEVWRPLMDGRTYSSPTSAKTGANAELNEAAGTKSDLFVPIFTGGIFWGALGFDDCTSERVYSDGEIQVLRGVAAAIAAALARDTAERGRIMAEHARAEEATRLAQILATVVSSSRELIDAPDFEAGLLRWLGCFGEAMRATRATFYDIAVHEESGLRTGRMLCEWARPGAAGSVLVSFAAPHVIDPRGAEDMIAAMVSGRTVAVHAAECTEPMRSFLMGQGNATVVAVPLFLDGRQWGCLSFDYPVRRDLHPGDLAVLQTAADTLAVIMKRIEAERLAIREREARIAGEQARTIEVEAHNAELVRRDALLSAVADVTRTLLPAADPLAIMPGVLQRIGTAAAIHRVVFFLQRIIDGVPQHEVVAEWYAPGIESHAEAGLTVIPNHQVPSFIAPLHRGESVWSRIEDFNDEVRPAFVRLGVQSTGCVPVFVDGVYAGTITFDDCRTSRAWGDAEIDMLTSAAHAVASALQRQALERARRIAERARADEAAELNHLLEGVVAASRALLEAEDFQSVLQHWLASLAEAVDADRAILGSFAAPDDPSHVAISRTDWAKPGLAPFGDLPVPSSREFAAWTERLQRGETVWAHRDELLDPASVRYSEERDCFTILIVPVVVDRRTVAWLAFDWRVRRDWKAAYGTLLRTAADGAASAIKRNEAIKETLAERECTAAARVEAMTRSMDVLRGSLAELAQAPQLDRFLPALMRRMIGQLEAWEAQLFDFDPVAGTLRATLEVTRDGIVSEPDLTPDLPIAQPFPADITPAWSRMLASRRPIFFHLERDADCYWPGTIDWHRQRGHSGSVCMALILGDKPLGVLGFVCKEHSELSDEDLCQFEALAQQATFAIALTRLADEAKSAAVAQERERAALQQAVELSNANDALRKAIARLTSIDRLDQFLADMLREAMSTTGAHTGAIALLQADAIEHIVLFNRGGKLSLAEAERLGLRSVALTPELWEFAARLADATDSFSINPEGNAMPESFRQFHREQGNRAVRLAPLKVGERLLGWMGLGFASEQEGAADKLTMLRVLGDQMTMAVEMIRLASEARNAATRGAVMEERNRLARDIHDTLAQGFTGIIMQLEAAEEAQGHGATESARHHQKQAESLARQSLTEARISVQALRPPALDASDLPSALRKLAQENGNASLKTHFEFTGTSRPLTPRAEEMLLRIAQEALHNAAKHAGAATITLRLDFDEGGLLLVISDTGRGFVPAAVSPGGFGLQIMRERAELLGGSLVVTSKPGQGTEIAVATPAESAYANV